LLRTQAAKLCREIAVGLCVFFGARANGMALDRYLALGWEYADAGRTRFSP
jgi:hypothetical protein